MPSSARPLALRSRRLPNPVGGAMSFERSTAPLRPSVLQPQIVAEKELLRALPSISMGRDRSVAYESVVNSPVASITREKTVRLDPRHPDHAVEGAGEGAK